MVIEAALTHPVSFHAPELSVAGAAKFLFGPEIKLYNWLHSLVASPEAVEKGDWNFVDYYAASCPHCVKLAPVWDDAKQMASLLEKNGELPHINFIKKECYGDNWVPGKDEAECTNQNIHGFPTMKLFGPSGSAVFENRPRNLSGIVDFIKENTTEKVVDAEPIAGHAAVRGAEAAAIPMPKEPTMVDYYAASCPHCKHMDSAWQKASHDFNGVAWAKKECLNDNWKPGKDYEECQKAGVQGFPTIRLLADGNAIEYKGDRSAASLDQFAKDHVNRHSGEHAAAASADAPTGPTMVEYYAASCHHCKDLNPAWEKASHDATGVTWQQKECLDDKWQPGKDFDECNKAQVEGYPTIKMVANGKTYEYDGDRSADSLVQFAMKHQGKLPVAATEGLEKAGTAIAKADKLLGKPDLAIPSAFPPAHANFM